MRGEKKRGGCGALVMWLFLGAGLTLTVIPALFYACTPLRWNVTASMPLGLYWATTEPVQRGSIVTVCLPPAIAQFGWERRYIGGGFCPGLYQPVMKTVEAMEGDTVEIAPTHVAVNGTVLPKSAVLEQDSQGRPVSHVPYGHYTLRPGEVWVMSTFQPNSWDSRYFGPVRVRDIRETARAVWVTQ